MRLYCSVLSNLLLSKILRKPSFKVGVMAEVLKAPSPSPGPQTLAVRSVDGSDKLTLILDDCWGHHHKMLRDKSEHVSKALKRMVISAMKSHLKGSRKRKRVGEVVMEAEATSLTPTIEACLYTPQGKVVGDDVPNIEAWLDGCVLELGPAQYNVQVNLPMVESLEFPKILRSGFPIVPKVNLEFANFFMCKWEWFRYPNTISETTPHDHASLEVLNTTPTYWPTELDRNHKLLLVCTPGSSSDTRTGPPVIALSPLVSEEEEEEHTPISERHLQTPTHLTEPDKFRVVTYNTLAGQFTADEYARDVLYPYCEPAALDIGYRQPLIARELLGYHADIMSLQEVSTTTFDKFLLPVFRDKGYDGCHMQKSGSIHEGEAIFFNLSKFSLVAKEGTSISDFIKNDPSCSELFKGLIEAPIFLNEVMKKHSIILTCLLQSVDKPNHYVLVTNTHLYFHPKGDHIRLVQTVAMVNYIRTKMEHFSSLLGSSARIAIVIGGDMNTCPCIAAYDYMVKGHVEQKHKDWFVYKMKGIPRCTCYYKYHGNTDVDDVLPAHIQFKLDQDQLIADSADPLLSSEDNFRGLELRHDFRFHNVTGTEHCTNYTQSFKAVLDYIFIDSVHLGVEMVVPMPSELVPLPTAHFPSDHLALIADLKWNS